MRVFLLIGLSLRQATVLKRYRDLHGLESLEVAAERILHEHLSETANGGQRVDLGSDKTAGSA